MAPMKASLRVAVLSALVLGGSRARAATFTVTTTADSGAGSLRQAVLDANGNPGTDNIVFNIPGAGVHTIEITSSIAVTDPVVVDGYTQSGSSPNTDPAAFNGVIMIEIRAGSGYGGLGIVVSGGTLEIHGVTLNGFYGALQFAAAGGSFVGGCFLGLDASGARAANGAGIVSMGSAGDTVGDNNPANRNVISGNNGSGVAVTSGGQSIVRGNLIGTDPSGSAAIGNGTGISVTTNAFVGGGAAGQGNVISGNATDGVNIDGGSGSSVIGNLIGLDVTGFLPLGNGGMGVYANTGGLDIHANHVSANGSDGINIAASSGSVAANFIGLNLFGLGEVGNGGAGVHSVSATGLINNNWIANNQYGLWVESQAPLGPPTTWSQNRIFDNGGLGIVEGNPPTISGPASAVITSVVPNAATTTITGFVAVPVGAFVPTGVGVEFFSSPACSKRRPRDFDEGKTFIGSVSFNAFGSPAPFSAEVPVVITDEVVTATVGFTSCFPLGEGGCVPAYGSGPFSQRLVYSITPLSGSPAGGDAIAIAGGNFAAGTVATIGGQAVVNPNVVNPGEIDATTPALPAGSVNDVVVTNSDGSGGTLALAFLADFLDVPPAHVFHDYVRDVVTNGVASGVGGGNFGVGAGTLRQQMAVFLLKAKHGICYAPPPCAGAFADVPCPSSFADWIEALAAEGITGGCGGGNYCPTDTVRRDQMAAFLLKAEHGSAYVPPGCAGVFADVPCPSPFADWIERLAAEGITGGCGGGNYCPSNPNTRGQMAVFLTKTFQLQ